MLARPGRAKITPQRRWLATNYENTSAAYQARGAGLTGASDGKEFSFVLYFSLTSGENNEWFFALPGSKFEVSILSDSTLRTRAKNAAGTTILQYVTTQTFTNDGYHAVCISGKLDGSPTGDYAHQYIDDASDRTINVFTNDSIDFTETDAAMAAFPGGTLHYDGAIQMLYFTDEYIDFSVEANRRKFFTADNRPLHLGDDGSLPTGTAALVVTNYGDLTTNPGTGGNFAWSGSAPQEPVPA